MLRRRSLGCVWYISKYRLLLDVKGNDGYMGFVGRMLLSNCGAVPGDIPCSINSYSSGGFGWLHRRRRHRSSADWRRTHKFVF